ncbi:unnamed protein product [Adineta steineri]|uniref:Uncharacterized protein n=1 Tax=Adineta steineri TaxID=433720 RepID=A0A814TQA9_9BILA|nr:unnamed protein product [Adineta steineri]CAF1164524.1 unnamed protein product [Adineta steineri]CAF1521476.1 unnamed protein product [Adineta steineri]
MYAPPPAAANRRGGLAASGPLLAICCLGFILFLIAATIVLALIPVYLSTRGSSSSSANTASYQLQMTPSADARKRSLATLVEGTFADSTLALLILLIESKLNLNHGSCLIPSCTSVFTSRRRRGFGLLRERRGLYPNVFCPISFSRKHCDKCGNKGFQNSIKPFTGEITEVIIIDTFGSTKNCGAIIYSIVINFITSFTNPSVSTSTAANTAKVIG